VSFGTRINAWLAGEVSAADAQALGAAGDVAYVLVTEIDDLYRQMLLEGKDPWTADPGIQVRLLSSWIAVALKTLGDSFLDADDQVSHRTQGFVPEVTLRQVMAFFEPVEIWLSHARQAEADPGYRLNGWSLPVELPEWQEVEPCPRAHLEAMLMAVLGTARRLGIQARAEAAMAYFVEHAPEGHKAECDHVRGLMAAAATAADMAQQLHRQHGQHAQVSGELHERIEESVKTAIDTYFTAGQFMAMPALITHQDSGGYRHRPGPGGQPRVSLATGGFDAMCLTDPAIREMLRDSRVERDAIDTLWAFDPDKARTLGIQAEIESALARRDIAYSADQSQPVFDPLGPGRTGHFKDCPWSPVYMAVNDCVIARRWLAAGTQFTFDVSAKEMSSGGKFRRRILAGNFTPHDKPDYGHPG
jgi:hypothetical protein